MPGRFPPASLIRRNIALAMLLLIYAACSTHIAPVDERIADRRLEFLRAGETTQQEIFQRLGVPAGIYEEGRIVTYLMGEDSDGRLFADRVGSKMRTRNFYELVLVFRTDFVLERYRLIRKN
jgi:hypothetical protein